MARKSGNIFSRLNSNFKSAKLGEKSNNLRTKTTKFVNRRPMASFFVALGILFLAIALNSFLTPKPKNAEKTQPIKEVSVYKIGTAPKATFAAKVDKKGVIQIVAQTPGIVAAVNAWEGQMVYRGNTLVSLSSNYQGGNAMGISRQLAALQYQNTKDTYDTQKGIIDNQREIANQNKTNTDKMREITNQGINDTQSLIDLNNSIISTLQSTLQTLETTNVGGANDAAILGTKQQISQFSAASTQLNAAQRQARFAVDTGNPPTKLAQTSYDLAIKQLDLQKKALDMSLESSKLQLALAQIAEGSMYPAAPFDAVVEKVHVVVGQSVNPGTPLVTIAGTNKKAVAVANVPFETASKISSIEESILHVGKKAIKATPTHVSSEATNGNLNSVSYYIPDEYYDKVSDGQYIQVEIPIGYADSISTIPYLPIDIVFQTQDGAFVYVLRNDKVVSRKVTLGDVVGKNVAIEVGLGKSDQVILDRNVIEGEGVRVSN